jgi:hypothetical protein
MPNAQDSPPAAQRRFDTAPSPCLSPIKHDYSPVSPIYCDRCYSPPCFFLTSPQASPTTHHPWYYLDSPPPKPSSNELVLSSPTVLSPFYDPTAASPTTASSEPLYCSQGPPVLCLDILRQGLQRNNKDKVRVAKINDREHF